MVNAISFCLFGDEQFYVDGFVENIRVVDDYYPDWSVVCYISESTFNKFKDLLEPTSTRATLIVVSKETEQSIGGAFWRFFALEDYDTCIFRDVDSLFCERERLAVEEWLESDKDFHIMRDHPHHGVKILAGMWGYKGKSLMNIRDLILSHPRNGNAYGDDQVFLADIIYPMTKGNAVIHDDRSLVEPESRPFPKCFVSDDNPWIGYPHSRIKWIHSRK